MANINIEFPGWDRKYFLVVREIKLRADDLARPYQRYYFEALDMDSFDRWHAGRTYQTEGKFQGTLDEKTIKEYFWKTDEEREKLDYKIIAPRFKERQLTKYYTDLTRDQVIDIRAEYSRQVQEHRDNVWKITLECSDKAREWMINLDGKSAGGLKLSELEKERDSKLQAEYGRYVGLEMETLKALGGKTLYDPASRSCEVVLYPDDFPAVRPD